MQFSANIVPFDCHPSRKEQDGGIKALFGFQRVHKARDRTVLYREGDPREHVFLVVSGVATRTRHLPDGTRHLISFVEPGYILGFSRDGGYHDETVEAVLHFEYEMMTFEGLCHRLAALPSLSMALCDALYMQGRQAEDLFVQRVHMSSHRILAAFVLKLRRIVGEGPDRLLRVPVRRSEIADYLGFTSETASRAFTRLRKIGLIETLPGGDLEILNLDGLTRLASTA